jgi:hypothetical protein
LGRVTWLGIIEIAVSFTITFACLWYVDLNPAYDQSTLMIGVILPVVTGSAILMAGKQRVLFFVFFAYFWSLVDDAPVHFDSVLTWPEVTRYQPIAPYFMDFVLLGLVLSSLFLALREYLKGRSVTSAKKAQLALLILVAFGLSYLQDLEVGHNLVSQSFYELELVEHIASAAVLYFTLRLASRLPARAGQFGEARLNSTGESLANLIFRPQRYVVPLIWERGERGAQG